MGYHVTTTLEHPLPGFVHVIGATGRSGEALCRALLARGQGCVPVVRNPTKFAALGLPAEPLAADIFDPPALRRALEGAAAVVSTVHARHTEAVLAAAPPAARLVLLGSARRYSPRPGSHGRDVLKGEQALLASGRDGVMLHPTMIYGAADDANVRRLAALLARLPVVPLPGGGRSMVQPIHQSDVTACLLAALDRAWTVPMAMVIAGPQPLRYAALVRAVAAASGLSTRWIVPVPVGPLIALASASGWVARLPQVDPDEIRRMVEDKAFDISAMIDILGVHPIPLAQGLARAFGPTRNR